jgi:hypothetical protein
MIDHFHGDLAALGRVEGPALGGIKRGPRGFVDLGAEGAFEFFVRLVGAGEIGVAHEEAFFVD